MYNILTLIYVLYANFGPVRPDGNPKTFMRPVQGGNDSLLCVIKGKLDRLTQDVATLQMDRIPMIM